MNIKTCSTLFFAFILAISWPAKAQLVPIAPSSAAPTAIEASNGLQYEIDAVALDDYVRSQTGEFSLQWAFSDTLHWSMRLIRHDVRSEQYRLMSSDGVVHNTAASPAATYKGYLQGRPESEVRMTIAGSFVRAYIRESEEVEYYFETTGSTSAGRFATLALHRAGSGDFEGMCGTNHLQEVGVASGTKTSRHDVFQSLASIAPFETEIAFVVDRLGFEQYASMDELELELLTILNYTDAYYATHQITYRLTETYVAVDLESQPWQEFTKSGEMLDEFSSWASADGSLLHHDVATLWTGISFGSTVGIAWINVIGTNYRQNVVNFPIGRERRNANVHAHELGHNWGSGHVGESGWIMSAALTKADEEQLWHDQTIAAFPGYIETALKHLQDLGIDDGSLPVAIGPLEVTDEMNDTGMLDPGETANLTFDLENLADTLVQNIVVSMFNDNSRAMNYVAINSEPIFVESVEPGGTVSVAFNVSLSSDGPADRSYRFLFQIADGSRLTELTATIVSGSEPIIELPVELISFNATASGADVVLDWRTASEIRNAGFQIERKLNDGPFEEVAFVEGAGVASGERTYRYILSDMAPGRYGIRLKQIDFDGAFEYSDVIYVDLFPAEYRLEQNYPNPFNPQTHIAFHLPTSRRVTLEVFDALGRRVSLLIDAVKEAGRHEVIFDAADLPNGTYVYRLQAGAYSESKVMMLLK